jgi:hypothetical protein
MNNLAIHVASPGTSDDHAQEQTGNQKEVRHEKGFGELDDVMHPALFFGRGLDAHCRMQHHHENDAHSFGEVDPGLRGIAMLYR